MQNPQSAKSAATMTAPTASTLATPPTITMRPPSMIRISIETYKENYWPQLAAFITQILRYPRKPISHEDLYRTVYNVCVQRLAETLYKDLINLVMQFLVIVREELLKISAHHTFLHTFAQYFVAFQQGVQVLCIGFKYLDKTWANDKLNTSLQNVLTNLFIDITLDQPPATLVKQKLKVAMQNIPPSDPSLLMALTKGLYSIDKDYAQCNPGVFALYIPVLRASKGIEHDVAETMAYLHAAGPQGYRPQLRSINRHKRKYETLITT